MFLIGFTLYIAISGLYHLVKDTPRPDSWLYRFFFIIGLGLIPNSTTLVHCRVAIAIFGIYLLIYLAIVGYRFIINMDK